MIEYPTERATPFPGIEYPVPNALWPTGEALPGVAGDDGTMGIVEYRAVGGSFLADVMNNVIQILEDISNGDVDFKPFVGRARHLALWTETARRVITLWIRCARFSEGARIPVGHRGRTVVEIRGRWLAHEL